jgi:hypothetical protein
METLLQITLYALPLLRTALQNLDADVGID